MASTSDEASAGPLAAPTGAPAPAPAPLALPRVWTRADGVPEVPAAVLVDKPPGLSSFGAVKRVRWALGEKRVGHAGTLDPMATGLLIVLVGRAATRAQDAFMGQAKRYTATVRLGQTTPSFDAETPVDAAADPAETAARVTPDALDAATAILTGVIQQVPPAYAAIKVGGERLYKKARRGEIVEPEPRQVVVERLAWSGLRPGPDGTLDVDLDVACSKGTYIRSLARDIGAALGVGGHLVALRREAIGPYQATDAWPLADLVEAARPEPPAAPSVPDAP